MGKGFKLPGVSPLKQEGDKFGLPSFDRSGYRSSGGSYSSPQDPSTYFTPGGYFAEGISSFGDIASEYIKNKKPEVNPDGSIGNIGGAQTNQTFATNLDKRIAAAEAKGDKSKVERLKGKKERRSMRDTTQAAINEKKNTERKTKLQGRLDQKLTNKGIDPSTVSTSKGSEYKKLFANMASNLGVQADLDTSTDGTALNMKNDSPNKFLGAAAGAALGTGGSGSAGSMNINNFVQDGKFVGFKGIADAVKQNQAQQAAAASTAAGGVMGTANQNPMTGGAIPEGGGKFQLTPVAMSYDPPLQANEKGGKKSVFNMNTKGMAEAAFGTPAMRQASVKSPFEISAAQEAAFGPDSNLAKKDPAKAKKIYDGIKASDNSPAASTYENPTPVVDYSGGYVASKALDTFGNVFADAVTAKYGNKDNEQ